ncbi:histidinol-phosphate transaminase [Persicobacter psychrovividus]|uniref:Histidinol-phosphate aminotransferase n=1 Tax=Persicobacter psychrovividus TaxID=387638 RepID=A0ABM7VFW8_9BACT|nr:histidinol-phosphate aminotransferase [Persicobacter psychrovividus]
MFDLSKLIRPHLKYMKPYSSARDEFSGHAKIFLDANENPYGSVGGGKYNRYPDPLQSKVKQRLSQIKEVEASQILLGNGSDEVIDLLFRAFCVPAEDNVVIMPPTYGMYKVCADINNITARRAPLTRDFYIDLPEVYEQIDERTKMVFICSPNNPTGNLLQREVILNLLENFNGLVVVDEAYIDYAPEQSVLPLIKEFPNLVILQTFSKAYGLAGIRLGVGYASEDIINILNMIKPPYNIAEPTQQEALKALKQYSQKNDWVKESILQREKLRASLLQLPMVESINTSDANFLLVRMADARQVYEYLLGKGMVVRDRSKVRLCESCLRITVGTPEENKAVVEAIGSYETITQP